MDLSSNLNFDSKIGILIASPIGSTVDLMTDLSLLFSVGILFNRLDCTDSDGTSIGILVGSTIGLVLNLSLICFVRILFKVRFINPGIGR